MNNLAIRKQLPEVADDQAALVKLIAMDIGKETAAHIEVMYPDAVAAASSTFLLSVRNHIYNEIIAAIKYSDKGRIIERLDERRKFRKEWKATYKKIRAAK